MYSNNPKQNNVVKYVEQTFKNKIKQTFSNIGITNGINNLLNGLDVDTLSHIRTLTKQVVKIPNYLNNTDKRLILLDQLKLKIELIKILMDKKIPITVDMYGYINDLNLAKLMTKIHEPTNNWDINNNNKKKIPIEFQKLINSRKKELNELLQQKGVNIDKMLINILDYNDTIILKERIKTGISQENINNLLKFYLDKYKNKLIKFTKIHSNNKKRQNELKKNLQSKITELLSKMSIANLTELYDKLKPKSQSPLGLPHTPINNKNTIKLKKNILEYKKLNFLSLKISNEEIQQMSKKELLELEDEIKEILESKLRLNNKSSKEYNFEDKSIEELIKLYNLLFINNREKINKFFKNHNFPIPSSNMPNNKLRELILNTFTN